MAGREPEPGPEGGSLLPSLRGRGDRRLSALARRFDSLLVVVSDGRRWCIPAGDVDNRRGILIGGPKYERFEVAAGTPIAF